MPDLPETFLRLFPPIYRSNFSEEKTVRIQLRCAGYTIRVTSRRYRFAIRSVQVNGDLSDVDFIGLEQIRCYSHFLWAVQNRPPFF